MHTLPQHGDALTGAMTARRRLLTALFLTYLGLLTWVVLWKLEVPQLGSGSRHLKLVPFVAGEGYPASEPREVLANLALFVPLGIYLRLLLNRWRWPLVILGGAALSTAFEGAQFVLALGRSDSTDVVSNTLGAVVGAGLAALALRLFGAGMGRRALTGAGVLATGMAVVACGLFVAGPLHYGPPDVRCDGSGLCRVGQDLVR